MNTQNNLLAPDLGMRLLREGYDRKTMVSFAAVPLDHISVVSRTICCSTVNMIFDNTEYAVSFDFEKDTLGALLAKLPATSRKTFKKARHSQTPPFTVMLSNAVTLEEIIGHLGEIKDGDGEQFVPVVVHSIC